LWSVRRAIPIIVVMLVVERRWKAMPRPSEHDLMFWSESGAAGQLPDVWRADFGRASVIARLLPAAWISACAPPRSCSAMGGARPNRKPHSKNTRKRDGEVAQERSLGAIAALAVVIASPRSCAGHAVEHASAAADPARQHVDAAITSES
jgi:hypothetical protein